MKRNEINGIVNFLDRVPISRIQQKAFRTRLTLAVFELHRMSRETNEEVAEMRDSLISGKEDRMKQFGELAQNYNLAKTVAEREQIMSRINRDFSNEQKVNTQINDAIDAYLGEDCEFSFTPFDLDEFIVNMNHVGVEITGRDMRAIEPMLNIPGNNE